MKEYRLSLIEQAANTSPVDHIFVKGSIADKGLIDALFAEYHFDIVEGVYRVMQGAPEKRNGADGLPLPPYAVYNIGGGQPENLLDYIGIQEGLRKFAEWYSSFK